MQSSLRAALIGLEMQLVPLALPSPKVQTVFFFWHSERIPEKSHQRGPKPAQITKELFFLFCLHRNDMAASYSPPMLFLVKIQETDPSAF